MYLLGFSLALSGLLHASQVPLTAEDLPSSRQSVKIAIVGSGIAGASTASHISQRNTSGRTHITVFERESGIGGRISTLPHSPGYHAPIEDGASWFATDDICLLDLVRTTGLKHEAARKADRRDVADWDTCRASEIHLATCDIDAINLRNLWRLIVEYGRNFWRLRSSVQAAHSRWQRFLHPDNHDEDLHSAFANAGFGLETKRTARVWFKDLLRDSAIIHDTVLPCIRARQHQDDAKISALSALLAARSLEPSAVLGGNDLLVKRALERPNIDLQLSTNVHRIRPGSVRAFELSFTSGRLNDSELKEDFDIVVLATPLADSNLDLALPGADDVLTSSVSYAERHVTLVKGVSPLTRNASSAFKLWVSPDRMLTSHHDEKVISIEPRLDCTIPCPGPIPCDVLECENLYRIVSPHRLTDGDISDFMDFDCQHREPYMRPGADGITWVHRRQWTRAWPEFPDGDVTIPHSAEISPGLFYTGGLDHVVSSMEMSCRMGRHVASRISSTSK